MPRKRTEEELYRKYQRLLRDAGREAEKLVDSGAAELLNNLMPPGKRPGEGVIADYTARVLLVLGDRDGEKYAANGRGILEAVASIPYVEKVAQGIKALAGSKGIPLSRDEARAAAVALVLMSLGVSLHTLLSPFASMGVQRFAGKIAEEIREALQAARHGHRRQESAGKEPGTSIAELKRLVETLRLVKEARARASPVYLPELEKLMEEARSIASFVVESGEQSLPAGLVSGVRTIRSLEEVKDLVPSEQAMIAYGRMLGAEPPGPQLRAVEAYRIASHQALVWDRRLRVKPIIYIDKSGSMKSKLANGLSRYLAAVAVALGIVEAIGDGEVNLFDEDIYRVSDMAKDLGELEKLLPAVPVNGGTDIPAVLGDIITREEEAKKTYGEEEKPVYIVITDSRDTVPSSFLRRLAETGAVDRALLILTLDENDLPESWVHEFGRMGGLWIKVYDKRSLRRAVEKLGEAIERAYTRLGA